MRSEKLGVSVQCGMIPLSENEQFQDCEIWPIFLLLNFPLFIYVFIVTATLPVIAVVFQKYLQVPHHTKIKI